MPSEGPNSASQIFGGGDLDVAWNDIGNAGASDDAFATAVTDVSGHKTETHWQRNFGFSIPSGASIDGIEVAIERKSSHNTDVNNVMDETVRLLKAGSPIGDDKASGTRWPQTESAANYGNATDLWGTTWTPGDINDPLFGMYFRVQFATTGGSITASVDHVTITVHYTGGSGGAGQQTAFITQMIGTP